jgi:hypothetical protein
MRISPLRLIAAVVLFAFLSGCAAVLQPPAQGTWSNFSDDKEKVTKDPPKEE